MLYSTVIERRCDIPYYITCYITPFGPACFANQPAYPPLPLLRLFMLRWIHSSPDKAMALPSSSETPPPSRPTPPTPPVHPLILGPGSRPGAAPAPPRRRRAEPLRRRRLESGADAAAVLEGGAGAGAAAWRAAQVVVLVELLFLFQGLVEVQFKRSWSPSS